MAYSDISLLGATYPTVPSILLPKSGGGNVQFYDVSQETTVAEADVASGKKFFKADGSVGTGTASGGGGAITIGALRGDATRLVHYVINRRVVQDDGLTIPAYTTSLHTFGTAQTLTLDTGVSSSDTTSYLLAVYRAVGILEYSSISPQKGVPAFFIGSYTSGRGTLPQFSTPIAPTVLFNPNNTVISEYTTGINKSLVYYSDATTLNASTNSTINNYCAFSNVTSTSGLTWTTSDNKRAVSFARPTIQIRGSTNYFCKAAWEALTDIHYQIIVDVWRLPNDSGDVRGFSGTSNTWAAFQCGITNGTLA